MKTIRTRRNGTIIATVTVGDPTPETPIKSTRSTNDRWARASLASPERKHLTKSQWCQRGELIRSIKRLAPETVGLADLSLNDLNDIYRSTELMQVYRIVAN